MGAVSGLGAVDQMYLSQFLLSRNGAPPPLSETRMDTSVGPMPIRMSMGSGSMLSFSEFSIVARWAFLKSS